MAAVSPPQAFPAQPTTSPRRKPVPSSLQNLPSERGSVDENGSDKSADDRALPKSPEGSPPPPAPHDPQGVMLRRGSESAYGGSGPHISIEKPLPPIHDTPSPALPRKELARKAVPNASGAPTLPNATATAEPDDASGISSPSGDSRFLDPQRQSRESDATSSTTQPQTATDSSGATSASSVSGANEATECPEDEVSVSPESSVMEGSIPRNQSVPQFQYHHNSTYPKRVSSVSNGVDPRAMSNPDLLETTGSINRHLTPSQHAVRRSSLPRPNSAYSIYSDYGPRARSPGNSGIRAPSVQSRKSPDMRPASYAELLNVPYPQAPPAAMTFDNSHLKNAVGNNAALLSTQKTLEMYRQNVKKTNDFSIQYSFAIFLISTAQEIGINSEGAEPRKSGPQPNKSRDNPAPQAGELSPHGLVREARAILSRLANAGYPFAQYYLADGYASGLFGKGKEDYNTAFPLFVQAAKHGHAESAYRAGLCYEFGWGTRKDPARAVQYLRVAATKSHPGAMTRLGRACLSGDLGETRYREGLKWLKLGAEAADTINNAAPYHLGCLYETGYGDDVFRDESYAAELFTQSAELGHAEANYRMGDAYEHGKLNCPRDPALSVHFYTCAAEKGHPAAMMGLCAWYMVGAEPILEKDEEEAYEWARRSAELGYIKAQYTVGYFTEMGIGCRRDVLEANAWYVKAADAGDERAKQRIATINAAIRGGSGGAAGQKGGKIRKQTDDKECIVM
ncbi:hypothetical protein VUR80DRAFT_5259 [Thermomyces stellatus]